MQSSLVLSGLSLSVYLGWGEAERAISQIVSLSIRIQHAALPAGCQSDELEDTLCYDQLSQALERYLSGKTYRLIERLTNDLFIEIKKQLNASDRLTLTVTKQPPMDQLEMASFTLMDEAG